MLRVFCSYSHKDESLRDKLHAHCALLIRQGVIQLWHDRRIAAGQEFAKSIDQELESSAIILMLVSADFIASDYCYSVEMNKAMERHETGLAQVIPIILRPCDWHSAPFGKLLATPKDGKAITTWDNIDAAFLDVIASIRRAVEAVKDGSSPSMTVTASPLASAADTQEIYCARCGEKPGTKSYCTGTQTHHDFKGFNTPNVICALCGERAGTKSYCTGTQTHHNFKGFSSANVICARCGEKAEAKSYCTGTHAHHDFKGFSTPKVICVRCGEKAGVKSYCTGTQTHHDFRSF